MMTLEFISAALIPMGLLYAFISIAITIHDDYDLGGDDDNA